MIDQNSNILILISLPQSQSPPQQGEKYCIVDLLCQKFPSEINKFLMMGDSPFLKQAKIRHDNEIKLVEYVGSFRCSSWQSSCSTSKAMIDEIINDYAHHFNKQRATSKELRNSPTTLMLCQFVMEFVSVPKNHPDFLHSH